VTLVNVQIVNHAINSCKCS